MTSFDNLGEVTFNPRGASPAGYRRVTAKGVCMRRVFVLDQNRQPLLQRGDGYAYTWSTGQWQNPNHARVGVLTQPDTAARRCPCLLEGQSWGSVGLQGRWDCRAGRRSRSNL